MAEGSVGLPAGFVIDNQGLPPGFVLDENVGTLGAIGRGIQAVPSIMQKQFAGVAALQQNIGIENESQLTPFYRDDSADMAASTGETAPERWHKGAEARIRELRRGIIQDSAADYAFDISSNVGAMAPIVAMGFMTGPNIPLALMGAVSGADKYLEYKRANYSEADAVGGGAIVGLGEALTEKLPLGALLKKNLGFVKRIALHAGLDVPGEIIQDINERTVDWYLAQTKAGKDPTAEEWTDKVLTDIESLKRTAITSFGSAFILGGAAGAAHGVIDRKTQDEVISIAKVTGLPPSVVLDNLDTVKEELKARDIKVEPWHKELKDNLPQEQPLVIDETQEQAEPIEEAKPAEQFDDVFNEIVQGEKELTDSDIERLFNSESGVMSDGLQGQEEEITGTTYEEGAIPHEPRVGLGQMATVRKPKEPPKMTRIEELRARIEAAKGRPLKPIVTPDTTPKSAGLPSAETVTKPSKKAAPAKEPIKKQLAKSEPRDIIELIKKSGGIDIKNEPLAGEIIQLIENNGYLQFLVNKKGKGLRLDDLAEKARELGIIPERDLNLLIDAIDSRAHTPEAKEKLIDEAIAKEENFRAQQKDIFDYITENGLKEGDHILVRYKSANGTIVDDTLTVKGDYEQGTMKVADGIEMDVDPFGNDPIAIVGHKKAEESFLQSEMAPKIPAKKPVAQDMFGLSMALEGKLTAREIKGDLPLETAMAEEIQRNAAKAQSILFTQTGTLDFEPIIDLADSIYQSGARTFSSFALRMKETLGAAWERVKQFIGDIWNSVKAFNERLGQEGAISVKNLIRKNTGQVRPAQMVKEYDALKAGFQKAATAARDAYKQGKAEGVTTEKQRMAEFLEKKKLHDEVKAITKELTGDIRAAYKSAKNPEARQLMADLINNIDFSNMSENRRLELQPLKAYYNSNPDIQIPKELTKPLEKLDQKPVKELTLNDLQALHDAVMEYDRLDTELTRRREAAMKDINKAAAMSGNLAVDYKKKIAAVLSGFDFKKPTEQKIRELEGLRDFIEGHGMPLGINPKYVAELKRLEKTPLKDMTTVDLEGLAATLNHLMQLGNLKAGLQEKYDERARQKMIEKFTESKVNIDPKVADPRKLTGKEHINNLIKAFYIDTMHAPRVADMRDGYKNYKGPEAQLTKKIGELETNAINKVKERLDNLHEIMKEAGITEITEAEDIRMNIVMRFEEGAHTQVQTLMDHYKISEMPVLTEKERLIIDTIREDQAAHQGELAAIWEEVTNEIFPLLDVYYLPLKYEGDAELIKEPGGGYRSTQVFEGFANRRFSKVKRLPRVDTLELYHQSVMEQEWYKAFQPLIENVKGVVLSPEYKEVAGEYFYNWWADHLDIISRRGWSASAQFGGIAKALQHIRHNVTIGVLTYKLSTLMLQPFAVIDAMSYAHTRWGGITAGKILTEVTRSFVQPGFAKDIIEESPALQQRQGGELAIMEEMARTDDSLRQKIARKGFKAITYMDVKTAAGVQSAVEKILLNEGLSAEEARRESEFVMHLTQGSASVAYRPHALAKGEGYRTWFTFQTFIMNRWGIIAHDIVNAKIRHGDIGGKFNGLVALAIMMLGGLAEDEARDAVFSLINGPKDKQDKRGIAEKIFVNLVQSMPFLGQIIEVASSHRGEAYPAAMKTIVQGAEGVFGMAKADNTDKRTKATLKAIESGLVLGLGVPGTAQLFDFLEASLVDKNKLRQRG